MRETLVIGKDTIESVKGHCPELLDLHLLVGGVTTARKPYHVMRHCLVDGHVIATFGGEGEIWFDGGWRRCRDGDVFVNPPNQPEAFRAVSGRMWNFCWFHTLPEFFTGKGFLGPAWIEADTRLFHLALEGFIHAAQSGNSALMRQWASLAAGGVQDILVSSSTERLGRLWTTVSREPGRNWTIPELCRRAALSREQLRFHSHRETGRSPMQQVSHLRMQRALELLQTTNFKIENIAELVGYGSPFAFSNSFFRVIGKRPSAFRKIP